MGCPSEAFVAARSADTAIRRQALPRRRTDFWMTPFNRDITTQSDAEQICAISEVYMSQFTLVDVATALHRIARFRDGTGICEKPAFTRLLSIVAPGLARGHVTA